jgi:hypothetical protein
MKGPNAGGQRTTSALPAQLNASRRRNSKEKTMETTQSNQTTAPADTAPRPASATNRAAILRRCGMQQIMLGVIAFVISLVITVATYQHPIGGEFVVWWGGMLFGVITVVRGLVNLAKSMKRG